MLFPLLQMTSGIKPLPPACGRNAARCVEFPFSRDLPAWLGLTSKPHSSGGKERLRSIFKMGNRYIRRLLYLGAMGVIFTRKGSVTGTDWLGRLVRQSHSRKQP